MAETTLTLAQIEQYRVEGYLVVERLFDPDQIAVVQEAIDAFTRKAFETGDWEKVMELEPQCDPSHPVARRIYNPFHQDPVFRNLATDRRVLERITDLIGPDLALHHSKLNMKPPRVGSVVEWHQDLAYFPHTNDDLVTTLIYLDDATEENGCLQVMPRHHSHYFDHRLPDGTFAGMITEAVSDGRYGPPKALPAPAGSAIFMHCVLPHSSLPNRSEKARRTLIYEYRAADAVPLHVGPYTEHLEEFSCHLQGNEARFARFGGPAPSLPVMSGPRKSLYKLQDEAKGK